MTDCRSGKTAWGCGAAAALLAWMGITGTVQAEGYPHPADNPGARKMLTGSWLPDDHHRIDFNALPRLSVEHVVVSDVRERKGVNQHNYLRHHAGQFWVMWSDGPLVEDHVGQVVKYSTSSDGLKWAEPKMLTPYPNGCEPGSKHYGRRTHEGWRYIARGFWVRDGELLALASLDEAGGFFGRGLALHAFRWQEQAQAWTSAGVVQTNAINNFPPQRMPSGEWAMSRRKHDYIKSGVEFLVGGVNALDDWQSFPVTVKGSALAAEEPLWWILPDNKSLSALFRDNRTGHYLYRAFSVDNGRTWSAPVQTDFPDATSKVFGMRLSDGRYVLVSNPNPKKRDPMTLAVSEDGLVFDRMFYLVGGRWIDYPHMIEHEGYLYVAHSGGKQSVEIQRVRIADMDGLEMKPARLPPPLPDVMEVEGIKIHVKRVGSWGESDKSEDKFRAHYNFMTPGGKGRVEYVPALPSAGRYEVFAWWNTRGQRHGAVPYLIRHADGEDTVMVDQRSQGGRWVHLGTYRFGTEGASLAVIAEGVPAYVVADGVRFVKAGGE